MARKKKSSFRGKVSRNVEKQESQGASYGYLNLPKGVSVFKEKPGGKSLLDFMPYEVTDPKHLDRDVENDMAVVGTLWYKKPFKIHRGVGEDNDTVVCPTTFGLKCPICDYRKKQMSDGADKDDTDAMKPKLRNLYCVIPHGDSKQEQEPHIWDVSQYLFQKLLNEELKEDFDNEVFPDLEEGLSLRIRFEKKTFAGHEFAEASRIDFKERDEAYEESMLDDLPNLDDILTVKSYDELSAMFFEVDMEESQQEQTADDEPADLDEPEEKHKRKKKTAKKEPEPEPDEEEGYESPEDWEDLKQLNFNGMKLLIDEEDLDIDAEDYEDDLTSLRKEIAEELDIAIPKPKKARKQAEKQVVAQKGEEEPKRKKKAVKKEATNKCPHGYAFGEDTDDHDECDGCDLWDDCIDAMD